MTSPWEWKQVHQSERCSVWVRGAGPLVETRATGRLDEAAAQAMTKRFDEATREAGHCVAFHDWWEAPNYYPPYRAWWEKWLKLQPRGSIHGVYTLTPSSLMRMGLTLANLVYPHVSFRSFKDCAQYEALLRQHAPTATTSLAT